MDDTFYRKSLVNSGVGLLGLAVSSSAQLIPDPSLAFIVSEASITISALALMLSVAWLFYGDLRDSGLDHPRTLAEKYLERRT